MSYNPMKTNNRARQGTQTCNHPRDARETYPDGEVQCMVCYATLREGKTT